MGQLLSFLDKTRKAPGYLPTGEVFTVDEADLAALKELKRGPFVADVTRKYQDNTTIVRCLIIGQDEIRLDRSTLLALSSVQGAELRKVEVDYSTITITVWEPTPELLATNKNYQPSKQASFDFEIKA